MPARAPLEGITVLDLSRVLSGPFAVQQLVDLGAEVVKIEHPRTGDDTRAFAPPLMGGEATYFMSINRGKKSVAIDLKADKGKALILELAQRADVVIENFRPGTLDRLGLGFARMKKARPSLVTCSISGYGTGGTEAFDGRAGYDAVIQGASGIMSLTGAADGPATRVGLAIADLVTGLYAAQGILAALAARATDGIGRHVEVSMQDAMGALLTYQAGIYFATGQDPKRMGDAHPSICPYETVQTADGPYVLAVGNDAQFARFAELIGEPGLAKDPRFTTNRSRVENRPALMEILGPRLRARTRAEWDAALADADVPGGPVLKVSEAIEHPQMKARGSVLEHDHPTAGKLRTMATPLRWDGARPSPVPPPPLLGQHTAEVLKEKLGLGDAELAALADEKVIMIGKERAASEASGGGQDGLAPPLTR